MRLFSPRPRSIRAPSFHYPGLPLALGVAVLLVSPRAWAQGQENAIQFLLDLTVDAVMFVLLFSIGAVTMSRNLRKRRRPFSIALGLLVGLAKLGWALELFDALYERNIGSPGPYHHWLLPWDSLQGAFALLLLTLGALDSFFATRALFAPAVPLADGPAGRR